MGGSGGGWEPAGSVCLYGENVPEFASSGTRDDDDMTTAEDEQLHTRQNLSYWKLFIVTSYSRAIMLKMCRFIFANYGSYADEHISGKAGPVTQESNPSSVKNMTDSVIKYEILSRSALDAHERVKNSPCSSSIHSVHFWLSC